MNKKYDCTVTKENLKKAFAMESEARNKYSYFASRAKKEGYEQIACLLQHIGCNEREHAEIWYKELYGIGKTVDNLILSAKRENEEWSEIYVEFADKADEEGFHDLAEKFRRVAMIEMSHEEMLIRLTDNLTKDRVFEKEEDTTWVCRNCGCTYYGKEPPKECPVCEHDRGYFEIKAENY